MLLRYQPSKKPSIFGPPSLTIAQVGRRFWHHPGDPGFAVKSNVRVRGHGGFPPRFHRKAWEDRQCATRLKLQCAVHEYPYRRDLAGLGPVHSAQDYELNPWLQRL